MNFAQQHNNSTRVTGFAIVVLIHMVFVWALATGLARKAIEKVVGPLETKVIEEVKKAPEDLPPPPPPLKAPPPPPFVPPPEIQITAPVTNTAATITQTTSAPPPKAETRQVPVQAPPPPARPAGPVKAAVACTKMPAPEVPGVSWAGEASFVVKGTVKNGRVVGIEVTSASMRGGTDRKAQRALIGAIESAMAEYVCTGNDIQIQQEFVFRIE
jgi:protein TonB